MDTNTSKEALFYCYIVQCSDGTYYIGVTNDIERRLKQHNGEIPGGAKYTQGRRPVQLKYYEVFPTYSLACKREWKLKQLARREKEELIGLFCGN